MANKTKKKTSYRTFGSIRQIGPNKFQASYKRTVDGKPKSFYGPHCFQTKTEASNWLAMENSLMISGTWTEPGIPNPLNTEIPTFGEFALRHIGLQTSASGASLKASTKSKYVSYLNKQLSAFSSKPLDAITKPVVDEWWAKTIAKGKLTTASKAYKLLHSVMKRAVEDGWLKGANPCQVKGAQNAVSGKNLYTPTLDEVVELSNAINSRFRVAILMAAYGALRFGELTALKRKHLELQKVNGIERFVISVESAVTYVDKTFVLGTPKNVKGKGTVLLSSALTPLLKSHLLSSVGHDSESLLFPSASGSYLRNDVLAKAMKQGLKRLGWENKAISPHSLRRAGATAYANLGANIAEVQDFLRDASPAAALRYIKSTNRSTELIESLQVPSGMNAAPLA